MKNLIKSIMVKHSSTVEEAVFFNKPYAHQTIPCEEVMKMMEDLFNRLKKGEKIDEIYHI